MFCCMYYVDFQGTLVDVLDKKKRSDYWFMDENNFDFVKEK